MKRLLILGASIFQVPFIRRAKDMGLYVGVIDINPKSPGSREGDEYFEESLLEKEKVLAIAKQFQPDGIAVGTCEVAMYTATYIAKTLGLPFLDENTVDKARNKISMIKAFEAKGVPAPKYMIAHIGETPEWPYEYPVVTKPADNCASKGIYIAETPNDLSRAIEISMQHSNTKEVLIEEYLDGPEVSVEVAMIGDTPLVLQVTDKITTGEPHFIEIGQSQPSVLLEKEREQLKDCASKAAIALGLKNCAVHAEIKMTHNGPKMVEAAARMGGHYIDSYLLEYSTGYDLQSAVIRYALGDTMHVDKIREGACSAMLCILSESGRIKSISGTNEARSIEGILHVCVTAEVGKEYSKGTSNNDLIGYVVSVAKTHEEALHICEEAIKTIKIQYE